MPQAFLQFISSLFCADVCDLEAKGLRFAAANSEEIPPPAEKVGVCAAAP
jgi:hypothetical protein